jgi:mannan endo-1,4-beta-mannosidase
MTSYSVTVTGSPGVISVPVAGSYTAKVSASNIVGTSSSGSTGTLVVPQGSASANALTRSGTHLQVNGVNKRFSGMNAFQLGTDVSGSTDFIPANSQIDSAFTGLSSMGCTMVRAHTLGQSAGVSVQYMTGVNSSGGIYNESNLSAVDRSLYQANQHNIYLMAPLTDDYNYYAGGIWNFVHFAYQQNSSGLTDSNGTDNSFIPQFFGTTTAQMRIRALFKDYISHWLNHVNSITGVAYKDDPYLALIETGNEINAATAEWTDDICSYIKSIAPNKLTVDGSGCSWGPHTAQQAGLGLASVDILSQHYYPNSNMSEFNTQLGTDISAASAHNQAFIIGEYPWTMPGYAAWFTLMEQTAGVSWDAAWTYVLNSPSGSPEGHGSGFGTADCGIHGPYSGSTETTYGPGLAQHICNITGKTRAAGY